MPWNLPHHCCDAKFLRTATGVSRLRCIFSRAWRLTGATEDSIGELTYIPSQALVDGS